MNETITFLTQSWPNRATTTLKRAHLRSRITSGTYFNRVNKCLTFMSTLANRVVCKLYKQQKNALKENILNFISEQKVSKECTHLITTTFWVIWETWEVFLKYFLLVVSFYQVYLHLGYFQLQSSKRLTNYKNIWRIAMITTMWKSSSSKIQIQILLVFKIKWTHRTCKENGNSAVEKTHKNEKILSYKRGEVRWNN